MNRFQFFDSGIQLKAVPEKKKSLVIERYNFRQKTLFDKTLSVGNYISIHKY